MLTVGELLKDLRLMGYNESSPEPVCLCEGPMYSKRQEADMVKEDHSIHVENHWFGPGKKFQKHIHTRGVIIFS